MLSLVIRSVSEESVFLLFWLFYQVRYEGLCLDSLYHHSQRSGERELTVTSLTVVIYSERSSVLHCCLCPMLWDGVNEENLSVDIVGVGG